MFFQTYSAPKPLGISKPNFIQYGLEEYTWLWSHDQAGHDSEWLWLHNQDGHDAPFKNHLLWNQKVTWYTAFGT